MIFFSNNYLRDQSVIDSNYYHCYFEFEDLIKRISNMVGELLQYNQLIDRNEAIKIVKRDNSQPLRTFAIGDIKRYILTK